MRSNEKRMTNDHHQIEIWKKVLVPLYGEREALSMWKWYREAGRPAEVFDEDLMRLEERYPLQYLLGYTWFYGRKMLVNEHTLIPRPETEELVFHVLERAGSLKNAKVIDLGTGSGCIPVTIAAERPSWQVTGVDIQREVLEVARKNADSHEVAVRWAEADLLDWSGYPILQETYDVIVSNPPYIPERDRAIMEDNVLKYEPDLALFASEEGMIFYREIARYGFQSLHPGGWMFLELHEDHAFEIYEIFRKTEKYRQFEILKDMQGKERILIVRKE